MLPLTVLTCECGRPAQSFGCFGVVRGLPVAALEVLCVVWLLAVRG